VLVCCSLAAWGFARHEFAGKRALFWLFLASLMVPVHVTVVPVFAMVAGWGWLDSFQGLIVPGLSSAYGVYMLRALFESLPRELEDAARLDGASEWAVFTRIALPLSKPGLAALGVLTFVAAWTDFLWPLLITTRPSMRTLEVGLAYLRDPQSVDWPLLMAASLVTILPVVLLFALTHRLFVRAIALAGLKG
jgi:multiple sugar transport system permease protein